MSWAQQWTEAVMEAFAHLRNAVTGVIPNVIGALVILGAGYFISKIAQKIIVGVLRKVGLDRASSAVGTTTLLESVNVRATPSAIVGALMFWFFMLVFLIAATDTLGLETVSATAASVAEYFPNVIAALAILVIGALGARIAREAVRNGAERIGVEFAGPLAQVVYGALLVVIVSLAVGQLRIETALVDRTVEVILLAGGAAFAITLGLGTRDVAKNLIAGMYARDIYRPHMTMTVGSNSGTVEEVGTVNTRIRTTTGEAIYIPNGQLMETIVRESAPADGA